jgi:hypothetical protein
MSDELEDRPVTEEERINNLEEAEERISRLETALRDAQSGFQAIRDCFTDPLTFDHIEEPVALPCGHLMNADSVAGMNRHRRRAGTANTGSANEGRASKRQCPERCPVCQETFLASTSIPTVTAVTNALEIAGQQYARMRTLFGEPEADPCCEGNSPSSPTPSELFPSVEQYGESSAVPAEPDDGVVAEDRPWTTVEVRPGVFERRDSSGALRSTTVDVGLRGNPLERAIMHIQSALAHRAARRVCREARRDAARVQRAETALRRESRRRLDPFTPDSDDTDNGSSDSEINSDHDSDSDGDGSMDDE